MAMNLVKLPTGKSNLQLRVSKGHYATSHSHINYYIDVTLTKFRLSEARAAAAELVREYKSTTIVDTILCLDGTEVIGACMASELTKAGYTNMNAHQTIYVVTPEHTTGSQLLFRENTAPMIAGKHVLVLAASRDLGNALIYFVSYLMMLFVATSNWFYLGAGAAGGAGAGRGLTGRGRCIIL